MRGLQSTGDCLAAICRQAAIVRIISQFVDRNWEVLKDILIRSFYCASCSSTVYSARLIGATMRNARFIDWLKCSVLTSMDRGYSIRLSVIIRLYIERRAWINSMTLDRGNCFRTLCISKPIILRSTKPRASLYRMHLKCRTSPSC